MTEGGQGGDSVENRKRVNGERSRRERMTGDQSATVRRMRVKEREINEGGEAFRWCQVL